MGFERTLEMMMIAHILKLGTEVIAQKNRAKVNFLGLFWACLDKFFEPKLCLQAD